jgi:hypothetical protein
MRFWLAAFVLLSLGAPSLYLLISAYQSGAIWHPVKFAEDEWVKFQSNPVKFWINVVIHVTLVAMAAGGFIHVIFKRARRSKRDIFNEGA